MRARTNKHKDKVIIMRFYGQDKRLMNREPQLARIHTDAKKRTRFFASLSASADKSSRAQSAWPLWAAQISAVFPSCSHQNQMPISKPTDADARPRNVWIIVHSRLDIQQLPESLNTLRTVTVTQQKCEMEPCLWPPCRSRHSEAVARSPIDHYARRKSAPCFHPEHQRAIIKCKCRSHYRECKTKQCLNLCRHNT